MERIAASVRPIVNRKNLAVPESFQGEILRKALHLLIAFVPQLASIDLQATMILLSGGTLFYVFAEQLRMEGTPVLIVSQLTVIASRQTRSNPTEPGVSCLGNVSRRSTRIIRTFSAALYSTAASSVLLPALWMQVLALSELRSEVRRET